MGKSDLAHIQRCITTDYEKNTIQVIVVLLCKNYFVIPYIYCFKLFLLTILLITHLLLSENQYIYIYKYICDHRTLKKSTSVEEKVMMFCGIQEDQTFDK